MLMHPWYWISFQISLDHYLDSFLIYLNYSQWSLLGLLHLYCFWLLFGLFQIFQIHSGRFQALLEFFSQSDDFASIPWYRSHISPSFCSKYLGSLVQALITKPWLSQCQAYLIDNNCSFFIIFLIIAHLCA